MTILQKQTNRHLAHGAGCRRLLNLSNDDYLRFVGGLLKGG